MISRQWKAIAVAVLAALVVACSTPIDRRESSPAAAAPAAAPPEQRLQLIDHLTPRRDSVGGVPSRFTWTPIAGADSYALGLWNEVDVLVWRADHLEAPSVTFPPDAALESGTYFWSVTAFRDGRPVAESGRSAFVVR